MDWTHQFQMAFGLSHEAFSCGHRSKHMVNNDAIFNDLWHRERRRVPGRDTPLHHHQHQSAMLTQSRLGAWIHAADAKF